MDLFEAYRLLVEAASAGADVRPLAEAFNRALAGEPLGPDFAQAARQLADEARRAALLGYIAAAAALLAVGAAAYFLYRYRRIILGWLWLKIWGSGYLKKGNGAPNTLLFDEEVSAVAAAVAVVAVALAVAVALSPGAAEPFSALGLLGPGGKIGGYPDVVQRGQPITLHAYVYNHMGTPMWYVVYVKVDNSTAEPPLPTPPLLTMQRLLLHNESWVQPFTISLNATGRQRLVLELWAYYPNGTLAYTGRWNQLWIRAK
ncbi:MAG: DUF1616 domain-containing protein [Pyrobaculum arsenaticum]|uniref:DUF1616 domain-containing protein n=2 Tax=Pyrobaculum arsenaticum TaxID=121277 RepID=A4WHT3_PYRAR|nr:DUF1616 domain-containing protein [Pyrobaculum arsenaticum]ABP49950.1 hypothetical protein Pars_0339 [Pyrobaculum arsenaticum DSM 13514]MCY0891521.1 DUF1616 domain-containing protein [Pyrobaculum arsenaticum]NYR16636.1 DUF1616 domain-containing protein [Pyrobaculum arsenaticum]